MIIGYADAAVSTAWRVLGVVDAALGFQQTHSTSGVSRYLNTLGVFTLVALATSAVALAYVCWLVARVAGEMARSDREHELHEGQHCLIRYPRHEAIRRDSRRRAG